MRLKRNKIVQYCHYGIEFLLLRLFLLFARLWPRKAWLRLGEWGALVLLKVGFYRSIVSKNLQYVGIWSPDEQARLIPRIYATMGRYAADFLYLREKLPAIEMSGRNILETAPGPFVFFLAHFGNWELLPALMPQEKRHLAVIAKPMKNPFVEKWLMKRRKRWNCRILHPHNVVRKALEGLQQGESIALLTDQYSGKMGRTAIFMTKPTRCIRTAAGLSMKSNCPALSAAALLQKDGSYQILIDAPQVTETADLFDHEARVMTSLQNHNDLLSKWITAYPEHWFGWFHRRFRESVQY